jgi:acyl dehydratase
MPVDDAVLEGLRQEIGVEHHEDLGEVSPILVKRFAAAVGEQRPLYTDTEFARSQGFADVVAPPNFLTAVINWNPGAPYDRLREDGTEADTHLPGVPAKGVRIMGGGEQMEFLEPVVAGTVVKRTTVLLDVNERDSRGGRMLITRYQDSYTDPSGTCLLQSVRTVLLR